MSNWIKGAIGKPGALHSDLGVPQGKKIPKYLLQENSSKSGVVGQRARLALTLEGMTTAKHVPKKKARHG